MAIRESLVKNTLRSYGGDYVRDGENVAVVMNGRIYKDVTIEVIRGQYLLIHTRDGVFFFEVVTE
jgi:hydrogenase maturation factor